MELKAAARTLVAADQTAISNKISFEQASERYHRDMAGTGMNRRIPEEAISLEMLRSQLEAHGKKYGKLHIKSVVFGQTVTPKTVPKIHQSVGPYPYDVDQILTRTPISVTVDTVDRDRLKAFYQHLPAGLDTMLDLAAIRFDASQATFTGHIYHQRAVTPPIHKTETPSLEALARQAKVSVPKGHPRLGEVEALLAKHGQLHSELAHSMKALGDAHLLGSRFRFYRERAKAIEQRAFPSIVENPAQKASNPSQRKPNE
jgi:hypothetical protein